jgi:iron complex transport system permease protein
VSRQLFRPCNNWELDKSLKKKIIIISIIALGVLLLCPFIGMIFINPFHSNQSSAQNAILFSIRIPRTIIGFLSGGALALCGMVFQAMFRNPLAEPFTLGIASGASFGAALTILSGLTAILPGIPIISGGAFLGASLAMVLVFGVSNVPKKTNSFTMLLSGVAVSFLFSSLLMFFQYLSNMRDSFHIVRWLMGGLDVYGYEQVIILSVFIIVGSAIIFCKLIEIDHLVTGEDVAQSRGVDVVKVKNLLLLACTLMVSAIVANCGPIGFVGLIIPYFSRRFFNVTHKIIAPVSFLLGGTFLLICDTISRTILGPVEIPVGVVTALCGAPFFLWVLLGDKKSLIGGIFH